MHRESTGLDASVVETSLPLRAMALIKQPLFSNAGYLMGVQVLGSVVGFVFWGIAARLYEPEDIGVASATLAAVALVSSIAGLGLGTGLVRFLPESRSPQRLLNAVFTFTVAVAFLIGAVFLAGLSLWSPALVILQKNVMYAAGFVGFTVAQTLGAGVQMAFLARRQAVYSLVQACAINGARLLMVVLLLGFGAAGLVGSVALATALAVTLSLFVLLPRVEPGYRPCPTVCRHDLFTVIPYSGGNYIAGLLTQTVQRLMPLVILDALGAEVSGYAYIAWMLASLLTIPGAALAGSAFAEGSNSPQRLGSILISAAAPALLFTVPAALVLGLTAPWVLSVFGPGYAQEAVGLLRWLALSGPVAVLNSLYFTHLRVQKRIGRLIVSSGVVATTTLTIAVVMLPRYGIAGSGMGWLVGNALVVMMAVYHIGSMKLKDRTECHLRVR